MPKFVRVVLLSHPAPYDRALALAALVRTMRDHFLAVTCTCGARRVIALSQMAADKRVAHLTLADVALRLSCTGCHTGPDKVFLTESMFGIGPAPQASVGLGWMIPLVERPKAGSRQLRSAPRVL